MLRELPGQFGLWSKSDLGAQELSKDILGNRVIGDRVHALVPKELFELLDPIARARYWVGRERWADAEARYREARVLVRGIQAFGPIGPTSRRAITQYPDPIIIECARFFASRGKTDEAAECFRLAHYLPDIRKADWKELLAWPKVRDAVFADAPHVRDHYDDDVFPEGPFAR
jgi:hypothetical protein